MIASNVVGLQGTIARLERTVAGLEGVVAGLRAENKRLTEGLEKIRDFVDDNGDCDDYYCGHQYGIEQMSEIAKEVVGPWINPKEAIDV